MKEAAAIKSSLASKGWACAILGVADCVLSYTFIGQTPRVHIDLGDNKAWFIFQACLLFALMTAFVVCGASSIHLSQSENFTKENALRCNKIWMASQKLFIITLLIFFVYAVVFFTVFAAVALGPGFFLAAITYSPVKEAMDSFEVKTAPTPETSRVVPVQTQERHQTDVSTEQQMLGQMQQMKLEMVMMQQQLDMQASQQPQDQDYNDLPPDYDKSLDF
jgi:hypothetical protein